MRRDPWCGGGIVVRVVLLPELVPERTRERLLVTVPRRECSRRRTSAPGEFFACARARNEFAFFVRHRCETAGRRSGPRQLGRVLRRRVLCVAVVHRASSLDATRSSVSRKGRSALVVIDRERDPTRSLSVSRLAHLGWGRRADARAVPERRRYADADVGTGGRVGRVAVRTRVGKVRPTVAGRVLR